jgi:hypothetical protein
MYVVPLGELLERVELDAGPVDGVVLESIRLISVSAVIYEQNFIQEVTYANKNMVVVDLCMVLHVA